MCVANDFMVAGDKGFALRDVRLYLSQLLAPLHFPQSSSASRFTARSGSEVEPICEAAIGWRHGRAATHSLPKILLVVRVARKSGIAFCPS
jgi:hypothetical protein